MRMSEVLLLYIINFDFDESVLRLSRVVHDATSSVYYYLLAGVLPLGSVRRVVCFLGCSLVFIKECGALCEIFNMRDCTIVAWRRAICVRPINQLSVCITII